MSAVRSAIVTGGASGIGRASAEALARLGFAVAVLDRSVADGEALRRDLLAAGAPLALALPFDLAAAQTHAQAVARVEAELGPLHVLVNNAGVPARRRGDLLEIEPEAFDAALGVNLRGTFFLTQAAARRMAARPREDFLSPPAIVTISSVSARMASIERGDYCLSKAALPMMVQLFALRLAPLGIGVFEVRPGIIRTPMTAPVAERYDARIAEGLVPAGRWGTPEDVAAAVGALASGALSFATGTVVAADGGLSIARL